MSTPSSLPAPKQDFIGLEGICHLATGGEPPLLTAHRQAFEDFARDKSRGYAGYDAHWDVVQEVRVALGTLVGLPADGIALGANASEGIAKVVGSIDWRTGDNVVVSALDYASGRYALANLKARGVEVRMVPGRAWLQAEEDLLAACNGHTRLMYVSQVNATTGQQMDMAALARGLEGGPTVLLNDVSHALGAVPVDAALSDFMVSANYKFILGIHDGILAWNRERHPEFVPAGVGWWSAENTGTPDGFILKPDAKRAEYGNVGHLGAYILRISIDYLNRFGIAAIDAHVRRLSGRLVDGYTTLGLEVMTPADPARRGPNAAFVHRDPTAVVHRAAAEGILFWGDNGRIRASAHLFTTDADVDLFLERLPDLLV